MRVLFLTRQSQVGIAAHASLLKSGLEEKDIEVWIEEASGWIPNETGSKHDGKVSERLKKLAEGFDLVHAFGYRSAWACSAALGHKKPWVYTAYDMPKTTHRLLISRLNDSHAGFCSSWAAYRELDEAIALELSVVIPFPRPLPEDLLDKEEARRKLASESPGPVVGGLGKFVTARGFSSLVQAMEGVWRQMPDAELWLAGEGPEEGALREEAEHSEHPDKVRFFGRLGEPYLYLRALDLLVVPSPKASFSMAAAEAMLAGTPTMVRRTGGLPEMVEADVSGFEFDSDEALGPLMLEVLGLPLTLGSVGAAGRFRAQERFATEPCVESVVEVYRNVCKLESK